MNVKTWLPSRHRSFGPACHAVLRALVLGMRRLRRGWVAEDEAPPGLVRWYAALGIELQTFREE